MTLRPLVALVPFALLALSSVPAATAACDGVQEAGACVGTDTNGTAQCTGVNTSTFCAGLYEDTGVLCGGLHTAYYCMGTWLTCGAGGCPADPTFVCVGERNVEFAEHGGCVIGARCTFATLNCGVGKHR
ncbi:MAG TPA: hypothetical protein VHI93_00695 [Candidatus Thermoplasmatota archaeon]|nr:hypothetical protein [Candidatus Thermoplasmatota archaeon]